MIKTKLMEEINNEIEDLNKEELGTEKYDSIVDGIASLTDRYIKLEELELKKKELIIEEAKIDSQNQKSEHDTKRDMLSLVKDIAIAVIPLGVNTCITIIGMNAMFEFEKEGVVTSLGGSKMVNRLFPKLA